MNNQELAQQVLNWHKKLKSIREIASILGIDKSKVHRILKTLQDQAIISRFPSFDTSSQTLDTDGEFLFDTNIDTRLIAPESTSDTVFDTIKATSNAVSIPIKPVLEKEKLYSKQDVRQILEQINFFNQEYSPFINEMLRLHNGYATIFSPIYQGHLNTIKRLQFSIKIIASQLDENHDNLLVNQVLVSIKTTIENILSGADPVKNEGILLYLQGHVRSKQFWLDSLSGNFLEQAV